MKENVPTVETVCACVWFCFGLVYLFIHSVTHVTLDMTITV